MQEPILVVMAAGMGSRYGGLKQVDPVGPNGQTIMDYSLFDAKRAGFSRVIFVISPSMEADFPSDIEERVGGAMQIQCAVQHLTDLPEGFSVPEGRQKPWGTGHAVRACRAYVDAPFAAINADDYYGPRGLSTIYDFLTDANGADAGHYAMVGYALKNTLSAQGHVARGICKTDENGELVEIHERTHVVSSSDGPLYMEDTEAYYRLPEDAIASMNLWGFPASFMDTLEERFSGFLSSEAKQNPLKAEYFLPEVVGAQLREAGVRVKVLPCDERWYGVTYREDRPVVERAIRRMTEKGLYPEKLWA